MMVASFMGGFWCHFMGAVHDFSALVISMRHEGRSISDIAGDIISPRVSLLFFIIVCLALLIVIAIFGLIIALIFAQFPSSVLAVWLEIPIAIVFGFLALKHHRRMILSTIIGVGGLYICVWLGDVFPLLMPSFDAIPATGLWTIILLIYAFMLLYCRILATSTQDYLVRGSYMWPYFYCRWMYRHGAYGPITFCSTCNSA